MDITTCIILIVIGLLAGILSGLLVVGGYFGSKLAISLLDQTVRRVFGVIMLIGAIKLIFSK